MKGLCWILALFLCSSFVFVATPAKADTTLTPQFQQLTRGFQATGTFPDSLSVADHFGTINYTEESPAPVDAFTIVPIAPGFGAPGPAPAWSAMMAPPFCAQNQPYQCVSDNNWATYMFTQTPSNPITFTMGDINIRPGWINIDVTEIISCGASGAGAVTTISHYVYLSNFVDQGPEGEASCPEVGTANLTVQMNTQPNGEEWTPTAVNNVQCGVKSGTDTFPNYPKVYELSCYVEAFYETGYVLDIAYSWDLSNSAGGQLCVWGWSNQAGEDFFVQVWNGATYTTRLTIVGPNDPEGCLTYNLLPSEVPQGDVIVRFIGQDESPSDVTNTTLLLDRVTLTLVSPGIQTDFANAITSNGAKLNGKLNSKGSSISVQVYFEWGDGPGALTHVTPVQTRTETGAFSAFISGLTTSQTYYFRAVGSDNSTGAIRSFTTTNSQLLQKGMDAAIVFMFMAGIILVLMGAYWVKKKRAGI